MIDVKNLSLILQKNEILKGISVEFERGKIHGLIGRNGSGKTMLMKCICGFVKPTSGEISLLCYITKNLYKTRNGSCGHSTAP